MTGRLSSCWLLIGLQQLQQGIVGEDVQTHQVIVWSSGVGNLARMLQSPLKSQQNNSQVNGIAPGQQPRSAVVSVATRAMI